MFNANSMSKFFNSGKSDIYYLPVDAIVNKNLSDSAWHNQQNTLASSGATRRRTILRKGRSHYTDSSSSAASSDDENATSRRRASSTSFLQKIKPSANEVGEDSKLPSPVASISAPEAPHMQTTNKKGHHDTLISTGSEDEDDENKSSMNNIIDQKKNSQQSHDNHEEIEALYGIEPNTEESLDDKKISSNTSLGKSTETPDKIVTHKAFSPNLSTIPETKLGNLRPPVNSIEITPNGDLKSKLYNTKKIRHDGKYCTDREMIAIQQIVRQMKTGQLCTLRHVEEAYQWHDGDDVNFNPLQLHFGQLKLFQIETKLLADTFLKALQVQQKVTSKGRKWELQSTTDTGEYIFLQNASSLCLFFEGSVVKDSLQMPPPNSKCVTVRGAGRDDEFWYEAPETNEWHRCQSVSSNCEVVQHEHLVLAKILVEARKVSKDQAMIEVHKVPIEACVQKNMLIMLPAKDQGDIFRCIDDKTRKLSYAEHDAVKKRIVVFSNGSGGDTGLQFVVLGTKMPKDSILLDREEFADLYTFLEYEDSKEGSKSQKLFVPGPHVLWGKNIRTRQGRLCVKIKDRYFGLTQELAKLWHQRWIDMLFGFFTIHNDLRLNHSDSTEANTVFMNKNLTGEDMQQIREVIVKCLPKAILLKEDDATNDSHVQKSSDRNKVLIPMAIQLCQAYSKRIQEEDGQKYLDTLIKVLSFKVKQDIGDTIHRQQEFTQKQIITENFKPHASVLKRNLWIGPGSSVLAKIAPEKLRLVHPFFLGHTIDYLASFRHLTYDAFTWGSTAENRQIKCVNIDEIKPLNAQEIFSIAVEVVQMRQGIEQITQELTYKFMKSTDERRNAFSIRNEVTANIELFGRQRKLFHGIFPLQKSQKTIQPEETTIPVCIRDTSTAKHAAGSNVMAYGTGIRNIPKLLEKSPNVVFKNFALEVQNVGRELPNNVFIIKNQKLTTSLAHKTEFTDEEVEGMDIARARQEQYIQVENNDYLIFKFNNAIEFRKTESQKMKPDVGTLISNPKLSQLIKNSNELRPGVIQISLEKWTQFKIQTSEQQKGIAFRGNYYLLHFKSVKFWQLPSEIRERCPSGASLSALFSELDRCRKIFARFRGNAIKFNHCSIEANCRLIDALLHKPSFLAAKTMYLMRRLYQHVTDHPNQNSHALNFTENKISAAQPDQPRLLDRLLQVLDKMYEQNTEKFDPKNALQTLLDRKITDLHHCVPELPTKASLVNELVGELQRDVDAFVKRPRSLTLTQTGVLFNLQGNLSALHKLCALVEFSLSDSDNLNEDEWKSMLEQIQIDENKRLYACKLLITVAGSQTHISDLYENIVQWTEAVLNHLDPVPSLALLNSVQIDDTVIVHEIARVFYNSITRDLSNFAVGHDKQGLKTDKQNAQYEYVWALLRGYFLPFETCEIRDKSDLVKKIEELKNNPKNYAKTLFLCTRRQGRGVFNALTWPASKPLLKHVIELDLVEILEFLWPLTENFIEHSVQKGGITFWDCVPALWNSAFYFKSNRCISWFLQTYPGKESLLFETLYEDPCKVWNQERHSNFAKYSNIEDHESEMRSERRYYDANFYNTTLKTQHVEKDSIDPQHENLKPWLEIKFKGE